MLKYFISSAFIFFTALSFSQITIISDASWKGLGSLSTVSGNSWLLQGYNDSSWPNVDSPNPNNSIPVVPGSQTMWVAPYSDSAYMRKTFVVPVADSYTGSISINADNEFTLYFNGVSQGFYNNWMNGPYVFNISPNLQGCVENVVAISAANWGGPYGASLNTTLTVTNPLNTPVADSATQITCTSFTANWDTVPTATNYLLDVSDDPNFTTFFSVYQNFNVGLVTSQNITGLTPGIIYYYRLRAERPPLTSCYSNVIPVQFSSSYSLSSNSPVCQGDSILLFVSSSDSLATFSWSGPNFNSTQNNPSIPNSSLTNSGNYTVEITMTGCSPFEDTVSVLVNPIYNQNLNASFCNGSSVVIQSQNISVAGNYSFSLQTINGCDSILNYSVVENPVYDQHFSEEICFDQTFLLPDGSSTNIEGIYSYNFNSSSGCDSLVTIHLNVLGPDSCVLIIPNVFSPNNDQQNDLFFVQGLMGENNVLTIYNRWGILVYETSNYQNNWNGKSLNNKDLPDGVYYYILTTEDDVYNGHVTLLR